MRILKTWVYQPITLVIAIPTFTMSNLYGGLSIGCRVLKAISEG
jgi:hypothetical protein